MKVALLLSFQQRLYLLDQTDMNSFLTDEEPEVDWWTGDEFHDLLENEAENDRPRVRH